MRFILLGLVLAGASAPSQEKDVGFVAEKAPVVLLDDLKTKLGDEGWVSETLLPEFLPAGLDKRQLSEGIDVYAYWIANPAVPIKLVKLRKGVEEKVTLKGLSDNCHNIPNGSLPVHSEQWRITVAENESPEEDFMSKQTEPPNGVTRW